VIVLLLAWLCVWARCRYTEICICPTDVTATHCLLLK